ncbi:hypothetical protein MO973_36590 [Paenibacillus sp. TRM 82003]|nr:hypothetical protein [Paenibacillus sp. TRM 82003]
MITRWDAGRGRLRGPVGCAKVERAGAPQPGDPRGRPPRARTHVKDEETTRRHG